MAEAANGVDADDSDALRRQLHTWAEKSGRALELRVVRALRQAGAQVRPSLPYIDDVTGSVREIDVVADFRWTERAVGSVPEVVCSLQAVVECKSTRKYPWIAFREGARRASSDALGDWLSFAHAPFTPITDRLPNLWLGEDPFTDAFPATHIVAAKLGAAASADGHDPAADAVRQVLAAAQAQRTQYIARTSSEYRGLYVVPVVVTAAPLFSCYLDRDGELRFQPADRLEVWGQRVDGGTARVYVLGEHDLPTFGRQLAEQVRRASVEGAY